MVRYPQRELPHSPLINFSDINRQQLDLYQNYTHAHRSGEGGACKPLRSSSEPQWHAQESERISKPLNSGLDRAYKDALQILLIRTASVRDVLIWMGYFMQFPDYAWS